MAAALRPRTTGLQAYQRVLKLALEDAKRELTDAEFQALRAMLAHWLSATEESAA